MKVKYLISSLILMLSLTEVGCRASFKNVDSSDSQGSDGEGDGLPNKNGEQNPDNPIIGSGNPIDPGNPVGGIDVGNGGKGSVDPDDGNKGDPIDVPGGKGGKASLTVTLPAPQILMGELKMQATAKLSTQTEPPRVRWSISGPAGQMVIGSIDQNGIYTSPKFTDKSFPISVIATLVADSSIFGMAPLIVVPTGMDPMKPILTVTVPTHEIKAGENKLPATAHLNTTMAQPSVTWSIVPPPGIASPGSIDQNGVYTSPKATAVDFPVTIVATLKSDPSIIGITAIIVKPTVDPGQMKPTLRVTLPSPEIKAGEEKMKATAILSSQAEPPLVTWSVMGPAGRTEIGTIDANGIYTSPKSIDKEFAITIIATLISDPSIFGTASLLVLPADQIFARCTRGNQIFPILADVYQINTSATKLPNFGNPSEARKVTTVCMDKYAVAPRNFDAGFPDVPNLKEWFALKTTTQIIIPADGYYTFYLNSDDGSKLWIDRRLAIDNDGLHQAMGSDPQDLPNMGQKEVTLHLLKGAHDLELHYFQGPMYRLALELRWKKPGGAIEYVPRESFR